MHHDTKMGFAALGIFLVFLVLKVLGVVLVVLGLGRLTGWW